ncbi:MAG TPA: helicase HerA-like domain-containing protein [Pyrinomonadaceae bacterium]|nr:helicase HerA-like domain-containing protein [Pyrinomonadaceae bacterium]
MTEPILVAKKDADDFSLLTNMANRHGVITGATGTGKTVTLQRIAEGFSQRGVPVFMADIKGDLTGISQPGGGNQKVEDRNKQLGIENVTYEGSPVTLWDVFGKQGHPLRATISEMGPLLIARMLQLNDTQEGVLALAFKIADENGLMLLDLKDLTSLMQFVGDNADEFTTKYGNVSKASVGAIQRGLLQLDQQGGEQFFGEPAVKLDDFMQTISGKGVLNLLAADQLINSPKLYSTFLLWILSELFETLPEAGDLDKPKLVFFFDEAHLLFSDAPPVLVEKVEQVVRLIRSKGVGVYFCSQFPDDVPGEILGQLGNRVQHALRAYTPQEQKAVRVAAQTFRPNPKIDVEKAITELGVGEVLISLLDEKGTPNIVDRALVVPPVGQIGPITPDQRAQLMQNSLVAGQYEQAVDRESAFEILAKKAEERAAQQAQADQAEAAAKQAVAEEKAARAEARAPDSMWEKIGTSVARSASSSIGRQIGNQIVRGVLGSILGGGGSRKKSSWF